MKNTGRIYLSVPHMGGFEQEYIREAFRTNWLSTVGPNIGCFEREFEDLIGLPSVAVASGTAAIHLGLRLLGVREGDDVFCSTLTFVASANPVRYLGAKPVFLDSDEATWNLDPNLLADALRKRADSNKLPKALIVVHVYGQCADMDSILAACNRYEVPLIEDVAEALGASYRGKPAGSFGQVAAFSFNGNKVITTTGGGMLVTPDSEWADQARFWATQACDEGFGYQHSETGYNYRMSNVLAGIGRGQLKLLDQRVEQRRLVAARYGLGFAEVPGITRMPQAEYGVHSNWLSCFLIDEPVFGCTRDSLITSLNEEDIESRPVFKPMHTQALFAGAEHYGGNVSEDLARRGICLPSSSNLQASDQLRVIKAVCRAAGHTPRADIDLFNLAVA